MGAQLYSSPQQTPMTQGPVYDPSQQMCVAPDRGPNSTSAGTGSNSTAEDLGAVRTASQSLGEVDGLDSASSACGSVIDALVPNNGDKGKLQLNLNIPVWVDPSGQGSANLAFQLVGETERDDAGNVKLRSELQLGLMGQYEVETWLVDFEVFLRAAALGYVESVGNNGAEAMRFICLAVRQQIANHSSRVADIVLEGRTADRWTRQMSGDEYSEIGVGLDVSAGMSAGVGGESVGNAQAGYRYLNGERYTNTDGNGSLEDHDTSKHEFRGSATVNGNPEFSASGKVSAQNMDGQINKVEGEIQGEVAFSAEELTTALLSTQWLSGVVGGLGRIIAQGQNAFSDEPARKAGQLASLVGSISPTPIALSHVANGALENLGNFNGITMGHTITAKASWEQGKGLGWELVLERFGRIEFGDNPRDRVYFLLENVDRVFKIP